LKLAVKAACPDANIRVNKSGCLDVCEHGVAVVVYPSGVWYGGVHEGDAAEIAASLSAGACPVARLEIGGAGA
jgi:(2Fe-2S) ferredoxin